MPRLARSSSRGQTLVLFALALVVLLLGVGLVIDGGYAFSQRRAGQNAADFAAMAGTRIVGEARTGQPAGAGTAANVQAAITSALAANNAQLDSAQYVDASGVALGSVVGAGAIPTQAFGVAVNANMNWRPYFLGIIGVNTWTATSTATAMTPGASVGGAVLPVGLRSAVYDGLTECPVDNLTPCVQALTLGVQNIPRGFGWLSFGLQGNGHKCDWSSSLGMVADGGCEMNQPFLDSQIGPPSDSHGCCTEVGLPGSVDLINTLTGNEWGRPQLLRRQPDPGLGVDLGHRRRHGRQRVLPHRGLRGDRLCRRRHAARQVADGAALSGAGCPGIDNEVVAGHDYCKGLEARSRSV